MATDSKLLLAFYGDDFTGSTDAMEALAVSGLRTVLFLTPPTPEFLHRKFPDLRCIGVAGTSRAMSPAEMDAQLEPVLRELWSLGVPLTHYKVCSTFDSAPEVGSIGHVADLARRALTGGRTMSVLAGAPPLRRYTVFGNHFAAAGDDVFRLDRHPTMSRHPVTPMHEADLRVHLSRQTQASVGLMSLPELAGDEAGVEANHARKLQGKPDLLLYDCADDQDLRTVGRLIWAQARNAQHFAIGSSGVEYALAAHWRASGVIPGGAREVCARNAGEAAFGGIRQRIADDGSADSMGIRKRLRLHPRTHPGTVQRSGNGDLRSRLVRACPCRVVVREKRGGLHRCRPRRSDDPSDPGLVGRFGCHLGQHGKDTGHGARAHRARPA